MGHHRSVALFGLVMLLLVGLLLPMAAGVGLWLNRHRLDEWDFAWKVRAGSFVFCIFYVLCALTTVNCFAL
jgi:hypothetical protein